MSPAGESPSDMANFAITMAVGQVASYSRNNRLLLSYGMRLDALDCHCFELQSYRSLLHKWKHGHLGLSAQTDCTGMARTSISYFVPRRECIHARYDHDFPPSHIILLRCSFV